MTYHISIFLFLIAIDCYFKHLPAKEKSQVVHSACIKYHLALYHPSKSMKKINLSQSEFHAANLRNIYYWSSYFRWKVLIFYFTLLCDILPKKFGYLFICELMYTQRDKIVTTNRLKQRRPVKEQFLSLAHLQRLPRH